jgi:hypothetical protein
LIPVLDRTLWQLRNGSRWRYPRTHMSEATLRSFTIGGDFPLAEISLYFTNKTILLPSEY